MSESDMLLSGEKLLWEGSPQKGLKFVPSDIFMSLFGAMFLGFSLFWETMVMRAEAPYFFRFWGIPFILVGAYVCFGRYFWQAYRRGRTTYVLTDRRAIIKVDSLGRHRRNVALRELEEVGLEESRDGSGSGDDRRTSRAPRFEFVRDVGRIYQMVESARNKTSDG